jgi:ABC-type branched-subunit amino acid transport system substrate-binding protein
MRVRGLLVALLVASASACGSTVQLSSSTVSGGGPAVGAGDGLSAPTGLTPTGADRTAGPSLDPGSAPASGSPQVGPQPTNGTTTGPGASRPLVPGGAKVGPRGTAPGVTATTIKVGVFTAQGFGDFAASAGFNVGTGNQKAEATAVINHINSHGGVAGRKIVPVFYDLNVAGVAANPDNEYAAACSRWTQDDRVYAVISPVGTVTDSLYACLAKAGVPAIAAGDSQDVTFFQRYADFYYQPADLNLRRILSNTVDGLYSAGFFGTAPKIAVLRVDNPNEASAVQNGLVPALARHGLKLSDSAAVPGGTDTSGYQAAVLRFRAAGITHVLFTFLGSPLLFMTNAENQKYYPRYGLHSRNSPGSLLQASAPKKQQHAAMGIGWQPMNDVDQARDPGVINPRQKLCLDLMKQAGQASAGRVALLIGLWFCDNLLFLQDAVQAAPTWSPAGLRVGAESLGAFGSASTFRTTMSPARLHDGASQYRVFAFKDDCGCYQYVSPLKNAS